MFKIQKRDFFKNFSFKIVKSYIFSLFLMIFFYASNVLAQDPNADTTIAQSATNEVKDIKGFFKRISDILTDAVVGTIIALGFVYFIWGVVQYVINPDDEGKKEQGKKQMIWGLIGLTVIFGVLGIINIIATSFDIPVPPPRNN